MLPLRYSTSSSSSEIQRLETLTLCPKKNQTEKHCNSCMMTTSSSIVSLSSDSFSFFGDYIGMESCFDLDNNNNDNEKVSSTAGVCTQSLEKQRCRRRRKREFPPPIPSLARTENLASHFMPCNWVLKRYYTSDGRLILREEKVRHQEYFRAHRSNGRLTLHLVPFNDEDDHEAAEEEAQLVDVKNNAEDEDDHKSKFVETSMVKCSIAESTPIEDGIVAKCFKYTSVRANPTCFLGLPVPAIRPVQT